MNKNITNYKLGYSNRQLEKKVSTEGSDHGSSPWIYWTSELYSFGRIYRMLSWYPKVLPLFFYSDHGIHLNSDLYKHEKENKSSVHFTFNPEKAENKSDIKKKIYLIQHPYVWYRKKKKYKTVNGAKGTLVFISHSSSAVEYVEKNRDLYFEELKKLSDKYKPLVLCMHMHDINKSYHLEYRKYGLPIVTCGDTSDIYFVDEFYKMVTQFKYATSNTSGSQLYYCIEMGMPYFLFGEPPYLFNKSDLNLELGKVSITNITAKRLRDIELKLFGEPVDEVTLEQKIFCDWMLGTGSKLSRYKFTLIVWYLLLKNTKSVLYLILKYIVRRLLKIINKLK